MTTGKETGRRMNGDEKALKEEVRGERRSRRLRLGGSELREGDVDHAGHGACSVRWLQDCVQQLPHPPFPPSSMCPKALFAYFTHPKRS